LVTEEQHFGWVTPDRELYSVQAFASKWINDAVCSWDEWQPGGKCGGTGGFIEPCMSEIQLGKMHDAISQNAAEVVGEIAHLETDKCCHGFTVNGIFDGNIYELQDQVAFEYDVQLDRILLDSVQMEGAVPLQSLAEGIQHVEDVEALWKVARVALSLEKVKKVAEPEPELLKHTLEQLTNPQIWQTLQINPAERELLLPENTFRQLFSMDKKAFGALPKWKRHSLKNGLFRAMWEVAATVFGDETNQNKIFIMRRQAVTVQFDRLLKLRNDMIYYLLACWLPHQWRPRRQVG